MGEVKAPGGCLERHRGLPGHYGVGFFWSVGGEKKLTPVPGVTLKPGFVLEGDTCNTGSWRNTMFRFCTLKLS